MSNTTFKIAATSLLATVSAIGLLSASPAIAQPKPQLEEIIVTAQRRVEALQNVPISITVASGKDLEKAGIRRMDEIGMVTPGVQIGRVGIFTQPAIRGITSQLAGTQTENNVAVYVDGMYIPSGRGLNMDLVNIAQISALKGPQGTLFGRNATGGAIMVQTLDPSMTDFVGHVAVSYSRYNDTQLQGYFSVPLGDKFAWNVAGSYRRSNNYIKNSNGQNTAELRNYSVSTKLRWEPTDNLTISLKGETFRNTDGRALAFTMENYTLIPAATMDRRDNHTSSGYPVHDYVYQHTYMGKIEWDLGFAKLASLTSYQLERGNLQYDLDGSPVNAFNLYTKDRQRTVQEDINLTSMTPGRLQYTVGFYYFNGKADTPTNYQGAVLARVQSSFQNTKAWAGYVDVTYEVVPQLFLNAGLRYSHESRATTVLAGAAQTVAVPSATNTGKASFNRATPRAVVRYQLDPSSNIYASYSRGFRSGFVTASPPYNYVAPEKIDAFEVGYKTARDRFSFNAAAYYYDYKNLQVSSTQIINGVNATVTANAASAEIYGAEAQVISRVTDEFNVNAGLAYTHARYKSYPNAGLSVLNAAGTSNVSTCPNAAPPPATVPCTQNWSGRQISRSPDWTANLGIDYTVTGSVGELVLSGVLSYTSSYSTVKGDLFPGTTRFRYGTGAYALLNLQAAFTPANLQNFTLTVGATNVTDRRYNFYYSGNAFGDYHVLGQPATWTVRADYRF
jgi:iron complex outermembrane receptor protein